MLNITHYQRNANQNHNEVPFHASQDGCYPRVYKQWRGCGEKGTLLHCWWECKLVQLLWRTVWRFLKKLKIELPYNPEMPLLGLPTKETRIERDTCTPVFITMLFTIARMWKQPRCPSADEWVRECGSVQFSSLSRVQLFATPWTAARQAYLSITNSWSLPKLMSIESVMPSNHLILCHPLFLLSSIFPSIRVFSNESAICIRWQKYWSFSFKISLSNECSVLISFMMDWLDLIAVQGTLKSLFQHHSSKVVHIHI